MGCCLSVVRDPHPQSNSPASSAPAHDSPNPVVSSVSPGCAGQGQAAETIGAAVQLQDVPAPLASTDKNDILGHDSQTLAISDPYLDSKGQKQGNEVPIGACNQLQHVALTSGATNKDEEIDVNAVQYSGQAPIILDTSSGFPGQKQGEIPSVSEQVQYMPSGSTEKNEGIIITTIRATNVALGLRRLPAGFYVVLRHNGLEWRTENKPSSVYNDAVEWNDPIPISSDLSADIHLEVYASFEYQPTLGAGEQLQWLTMTVGQLLECSTEGTLYTFIPEDGDVVSPCSSILVTVKQQKRESYDPSGSRVVGPHWSTPEPRGELEDATDQGHCALTHYRKNGEKRDLEHSIQQFERALDICPWDDPRQAVAKSNLAMAKLILSQPEGVDGPLEAALQLHRDALIARPVGHPDRPLTLIQLASVHLIRLQRRRNSVDEANNVTAEGLLREVIEISATESYEKQAATLLLLLCGQSSLKPDPTPSSTDEDPWRLSDQLLSQYERRGDLADLQRAIAILEELVESTSFWGANHCAALQNLGIALWYRFGRLGRLDDLEEAVSTQKEAVRLTLDGHPEKPSRLNNLGNSFQTRFARLGQLSDLEDAISRKKEAVRLTPDDHLHKPMYLNNLGISFEARFSRLGQLDDLEDAISIQKEAVRLTPDGHPNKPRRLINLGNSFETRFSRLGQLNDLEDAISTQKEAVRLTPDGHPDKPSRLINLGSSFETRFSRFGRLDDLEDAILRLKEAVCLTPDSHPDKPSRLNNLGISFKTRFSRLGQLNDLEDAISRLKEADHLTPDDHPDKPMYLNNLGISFQARFSCLGQLNDLEDAISRLKEADHLTPDDHPDKPMYLNNLGISFEARFSRLGQLDDLEDAISIQKEAVRLTPDGHPNKPRRLINLGNSFETRFSRLGQLNDLEDAISIQKEAVGLTPDGHPDKPSRLINLGNSFETRFSRFGRLDDLEDAILRLKEAVCLTPDSHPDKPSRLNNLGISFKTRFSRLGQLGDLEDAISRLKEAVRLTPDGHPDESSRLNNLGISFEMRFSRLGQLDDLEDAISIQKEAVRLALDGHPDKPIYLNNLGISFKTRFSRRGQLGDLEDAISIQKEAVRLTPDGHPDKPMYLNNLGTSFEMRFSRLEQLNDLKDAISRLEEAVRLTPDGHPEKLVYLNNLGISFKTSFSRLGQLDDLEDAISRLKEAVRIAPDGHPDKPMYLNNLGTSFEMRFSRLGQLNDLEEAVSIQKEAVCLTPDGHPEKPMYLNNLGISFETRFSRLGQLDDLEDAISRGIDAARLTPHDHPQKPTYLNHLARCFISRFLHFRQVTDLQRAISLSSHIALIPIAQPRVRLSAAQRWIQYTPLIRHPSLLHAHSVAASLIPQLAWVGLPLSHRYDQLIQSADVVREAAAAALEAGFPETALEWLEQGRSVIWGDLFQLRSSYDELSSVHPDYASRLHALSTQLDQASAAHEQSLSTLSKHAPESLRAVADRHRALAIERDKLLQEIRRLPGFEKFLLRKPFSQLRAAAHSGPVVILNAAKSRCDALIVVAGLDHVIHVPLPTLTFDRSLFLQKTLQGFVRDIRVGDEGKRIGISWKTVLSPLWKSVVKPVLDALAIQSTSVDPSRIFWCPTGPLAFLPIHAAGFYDEQHLAPGHKVFDFVVSSYVPTLSTLLESSKPNSLPNSPLRLLFVPQPPTDGNFKLSGVAVELQHIRDVVSNSPVACTMSKSSDGTVEEVLDLMREADWVHFACHGAQEGVDSGLCLANERRLKLGDIVALSRPRGGLAFLSACETAKGEQRLSDEAIHIAAGMLFAGYGGVIGTMWVISDVVAPNVAKMVYEKLLGKGPRADYREAARALHEATRALREQGSRFNEWIPFIHVGL